MTIDTDLTATDFGAGCLIAVYGTVRTGGALDGWLGECGYGTPRRTIGMGYLDGFALFMHPHGGGYPVAYETGDGRTRVEVLATSLAEAKAFLAMEESAGYEARFTYVTRDDGRRVWVTVVEWNRIVHKADRIPNDDWWMMDSLVADTAEHRTLVRAFDPTEQDPT